MQKIYELVSEGAGRRCLAKSAPLSPPLSHMARDKKNGMQTSPLTSGSSRKGLAIQERLREVGRELKENHADLLLSKKNSTHAASRLESTSLCPHCPDPPPPVD